MIVFTALRFSSELDAPPQDDEIVSYQVRSFVLSHLQFLLAVKYLPDHVKEFLVTLGYHARGAQVPETLSAGFLDPQVVQTCHEDLETLYRYCSFTLGKDLGKKIFQLLLSEYGQAIAKEVQQLSG